MLNPLHRISIFNFLRGKKLPYILSFKEMFDFVCKIKINCIREAAHSVKLKYRNFTDDISEIKV